MLALAMITIKTNSPELAAKLVTFMCEEVFNGTDSQICDEIVAVKENRVQTVSLMHGVTPYNTRISFDDREYADESPLEPGVPPQFSPRPKI